MPFRCYSLTKTGNLTYKQIQSPDYLAGVQGWQIRKDGSAEFNNVTIRGGEVVDGTTLIYSPSPGAGNLVASISATGGTDAYGNTYQAGAVSYTAGGLAGLYLGALQLFGSADGWQVTTGPVIGGHESLALFPSLTYGGGLGGKPVYVGFDGTVYAANPANTAINESWHSLGTLAGYTVNLARYRLTALGELEVQVSVTSAGANAATVNFSAALAAAYQPASALAQPAISNLAVTLSPFVEVSGGTVSVHQDPNKAATIQGSWKFPLN